jgi:hypothetical protein
VCFTSAASHFGHGCSLVRPASGSTKHSDKLLKAVCTYGKVPDGAYLARTLDHNVVLTGLPAHATWPETKGDALWPVDLGSKAVRLCQSLPCSPPDCLKSGTFIDGPGFNNAHKGFARTVGTCCLQWKELCVGLFTHHKLLNRAPPVELHGDSGDRVCDLGHDQTASNEQPGGS